MLTACPRLLVGFPLFLVACALCLGACGDSVSPTGPSSSGGLGNVTGQVIATYGGQPIAGAYVAIGDGEKAGQATSTVANGSFVLKNIKESAITIGVGATGYAAVVIAVDRPTLSPIGLEPLFTDYTLSGRFRDQPSDPVDPGDLQVAVTTHLTGPITLSAHADCPTASETQPLYLRLLGQDGKLLAATLLANFAERDSAVTRVLAPGQYVGSFHALSYETRGGCAWSMTIRAPL